MSRPALDRHANNVSAPVPTGDLKRRRHALRRAAGRLLPAERVANCGQKAVGQLVTLHQHDGHAHFGGIETCSSVWACPVCTARITEGRRAEIDALLTAHLEAGGVAYMATLTMPHNRFQRCRDLRQGVSTAYRMVKRGRPWQRARDAHGLAGDIRALEVTYGNNGWHPHLHILVFFRPGTPEACLSGFGDWLLDTWSAAIAKLDFGTCSAQAFTWERVTGPSGAADYVGKWGAALELTKASTKRGKAGGRSPWQILGDFLDTGSAEDGRLFREYAAAFKGARQLTYSRGLRDLYPVPPEASDQDLAEQPPAPATHTATITKPLFRAVVSHGATADVLAAHETAGLPGVLDCLNAIGIPWRLSMVPGLERGRRVPLIALGSVPGTFPGSSREPPPLPSNALKSLEGEFPLTKPERKIS